MAGGRGCGARGQASQACLREAPGSRPSLLRGTALQWAGRGADEGGRKPAGSGAQQGPVRARKLRPRGQKSPANKPGLRKLVRVERREAPAPSEKKVRHEGYRKRLTALHPLDCSRGLRRAPRNGAGRRRTRRRKERLLPSPLWGGVGGGDAGLES